MRVAVLAFGLATPLAAQTPAQAPGPLPTAESLLARYVDALGGRDALAQPTSTRMVGTLEAAAQGITGDLQVLAAAPDRLLVTLDIPGIGSVRSGYDGTVGWIIHPAMGPMLLEGRMLDQLRQQADFYAQLHPERHIASMETVERTEFAGRPCFKVKVVTRWGEEYVEYYDAETGLLAGNVRTQESPMGGLETTTIVGDYKAFGSVLIATRVLQRMLGQEQVMTFGVVEFDGVADSVFALPAEVKVLVRP